MKLLTRKLLSIPLNGFPEYRWMEWVKEELKVSFNSIEWIPEEIYNYYKRGGYDETFNSIEWIQEAMEESKELVTAS